MIRAAIGKVAYKDILLYKIVSFFTGSMRANGDGFSVKRIRRFGLEFGAK